MYTFVLWPLCMFGNMHNIILDTIGNIQHKLNISIKGIGGPDVGHKPSRLRFWTHVCASSSQDTCVTPTYTAYVIFIYEHTSQEINTHATWIYLSIWNTPFINMYRMVYIYIYIYKFTCLDKERLDGGNIIEFAWTRHFQYQASEGAGMATWILKILQNARTPESCNRGLDFGEIVKARSPQGLDQLAGNLEIVKHLVPSSC